MRTLFPNSANILVNKANIWLSKWWRCNKALKHYIIHCDKGLKSVLYYMSQHWVCKVCWKNRKADLQIYCNNTLWNHDRQSTNTKINTTLQFCYIILYFVTLFLLFCLEGHMFTEILSLNVILTCIARK